MYSRISLFSSRRRRRWLGQPSRLFALVDSTSRIPCTPRKQRWVYFPRKITTCPDNTGYHVAHWIQCLEYGEKDWKLPCFLAPVSRTPYKCAFVAHDGKLAFWVHSTSGKKIYKKTIGRYGDVCFQFEETNSSVELSSENVKIKNDLVCITVKMDVFL